MPAQTKITVEMNKRDYTEFKKRMPKGGVALVVRGLMRSLAIILDRDGLAPIWNWLYGKAELTLPKIPPLDTRRDSLNDYSEQDEPV